MSFDADRLFALLPAIHRLRDAEIALATPLLSGAEQAELAALDGKARNAPPPLTPDEGRRRDALRRKAETGPLKSLLSIVAEQVAGIEENVAQLYDDLFIETCADWVVPYIGDLVGYAAIGKVVGSVASRAEVADTIRSRRAKGTAVSIEGVARDVTGRDATVVEYFRRMAVTQTLNHLRPAVTTASLRKPLDDVDPGGPFDLVARGVDLRPPNLGGRTNIPNLGIFLWNWQGLGLTGVTAVRVDAARFLFDPLGQDRPLVVAGVRGTRLSGQGNVVRALSRRDAAAMPAAAIAAAFAIRVGGAAVDRLRSASAASPISRPIRPPAPGPACRRLASRSIQSSDGLLSRRRPPTP